MINLIDTLLFQLQFTIAFKSDSKRGSQFV